MDDETREKWIRKLQPGCIIKGCNNRRYKNKAFCEYHWKERRNKKNYKEEE